MSLNAKSVLLEVQKMRELQKEYFRSRSGVILEESKAQERKVDNLIREALADSKQLSLLED